MTPTSSLSRNFPTLRYLVAPFRLVLPEPSAGVDHGGRCCWR